MKIFNQTPDTCERSHIEEIYSYLNKEFNDDWGLYVRRNNQPVFNLVTKYGICIILSAEGHSYLPPETKEMPVFMNYLIKKNTAPIEITIPKNGIANINSSSPFYFFNPDNFVRSSNLFELQLGTTNWFTGTHTKPINQRKYDFSFIGQFDPYTRYDFYQCASGLKGGFIHFYEGWNKGLGPEIYSEIMSETKIALVPCGSASLDTFRFYEAMSCGCIVLSVKQNNYEFMKNSPHLQIPSWNTPIVEKYIQKLINSVTLQQLSNKSREFWETNLSPTAAAKFIINKIRGIK